MNRLLAKADSQEAADKRIEILEREFPDYTFEKKNTDGETRTEIIIKDVKVGVNVQEQDVERMKRIAQGLYIPPDKTAPKKTPEVAKNITTGSQAVGKQTAPASPTIVNK